MSRSLTIAIIAISMACGGGSRPEAGPPPVGSATAKGSAAPAPVPPPIPTCEQVTFAETTTLPEASGATWLADGGLIVIADSGHDGAYVVLDPETGKERESGKLPIGSGTDDIEGLAMWNGKLVGISSAGWIRVWQKTGASYALVEGPYPLGPVNLPDKGYADADDPGMVCSERKTNCGRDYEGICLAAGSDQCAGFALAKADGALYCLRDQAGKLVVDRSVSIKIGKRGALADCTISDRGELFVGANLFDAANVYRVTNWMDPAKAHVDKLGSLGIGFNEVIAARGEMIYRLSDTGGDGPSLMTKYRCR